MKIVGYMLLSGPYAPDPTYRNVYHYKTQAVGMNPNTIPLVFFEDLRAPDGSYLYDFRYTPTFPANTALYPVGESDVGFTIELPTDEGFPERPQYIIANVGTLAVPYYRYAFIDGYVRTGSDKIRCTCRFDQWTEHYAELMAAEFTFSRRHQKRYVDRTAATRTKLYNGLSDPVPEGMVLGQKRVDIIPDVYGMYNVPSTRKYYIPIWIYWRVSTNDLYYKSENTYVSANGLLGVDGTKGSVPVLARCIGTVEYDESGRTASHTIQPLNHVYKKDGTDINVTGSVSDVITYSHPYITQAMISTIPPVPCHATGAGSIQIDDAHFNVSNYWIVPVGQRDRYRIGADMFPPTGTFLGNIGAPYYGEIYSGTVKSYPVTSNTTSDAYDPFYEPKIEETAYEQKTLSLFGADIDVSPTPANPKITLHASLGSHFDYVLTSGTDEVHRLSGISWEYGIDMANDALSQWAVSNWNTFSNASIWKSIDNLRSGGSGMIGSAMMKDVGGALSAVGNWGLNEISDIEREWAQKQDLINSPAAINLSSRSGLDNLPFIDLPVLKHRIIPDDIKTKIMAYWHVYGYPDNKIGTIETDATLRESFTYVQGALVNMIPGVYPGEISEIMSALRSGVWLWETRFNEPATKAVPDYEYVDRTKPMLTIQNNEVI